MKNAGRREGSEAETLVTQEALEAAPVSGVDKDKWCATALQPGRKTPRPRLSAAAFSLLSCHNQQKKKAKKKAHCHRHRNTFRHTLSIRLTRPREGKFDNCFFRNDPHTIVTAAVCMARWKAGTGSDLTPSCLLSSPLSSLFPELLIHFIPILPLLSFFPVHNQMQGFRLVFQLLCSRLLPSLASIAGQYGPVASAVAKAPLSGESIQ